MALFIWSCLIKGYSDFQMTKKKKRIILNEMLSGMFSASSTHSLGLAVHSCRVPSAVAEKLELVFLTWFYATGRISHPCKMGWGIFLTDFHVLTSPASYWLQYVEGRYSAIFWSWCFDVMWDVIQQRKGYDLWPIAWGVLPSACSGMLPWCISVGTTSAFSSMQVLKVAPVPVQP